MQFELGGSSADNLNPPQPYLISLLLSLSCTPAVPLLCFACRILYKYYTSVVSCLEKAIKERLLNEHLCQDDSITSSISGKGLQLSLSKNKMGGWQFAIILL